MRAPNSEGGSGITAPAVKGYKGYMQACVCVRVVQNIILMQRVVGSLVLVAWSMRCGGAMCLFAFVCVCVWKGEWGFHNTNQLLGQKSAGTARMVTTERSL